MINRKIERFAFGIKIAEGWLPEKESLTWKNHNAGALRFSPFALGGRNGFAYFLNDDVGFFALCWDLVCKCKGNTRTSLNEKSSIEDLIKIYTTETDPIKLNNYIKMVELITGKSRKTQLKYFN